MSRSSSPCVITRCGKKIAARGWCAAHYKQWNRYGDPLFRTRPHARTIEDRLWPRLTPDGDCWIWTGAASPEGYGRIWTGERTAEAHRVAYEQMVCEIPEGLELDHLCRRPACCNPYHLDPVTKAINIARANRDNGRSRKLVAA